MDAGGAPCRAHIRARTYPWEVPALAQTSAEPNYFVHPARRQGPPGRSPPASTWSSYVFASLKSHF